MRRPQYVVSVLHITDVPLKISLFTFHYQAHLSVTGLRKDPPRGVGLSNV